MPTITPQPVTAIKYVVEFTEAEARAIVADPAPFVRELRAALGETRPRTNGHPRSGPARRRAAPRSNGYHVHACPEPGCGRKFVNKRALGVHLRKAHGAPKAAPAE